MSPPYMPLYVADYLSATQHLDAAYSGAYLHLLMHFWQKGFLPQEDKFLAKIARMGFKQWTAAKPTIKAFFNDDWTHARAAAERDKANAKAEARSSAGSRGGHAKALKTIDAGMANATLLSQQNSKQNASSTLPSSQGLDIEIASAISIDPPKRKRPRIKTAISSEAQPLLGDREASVDAGLDEAMFRIEWKKFRDHHLSKGNLMADWSAAWRTWLGNIAQFQPKAIGTKDGKPSVQEAARRNHERGVDFGPIPPPYLPTGCSLSQSSSSALLLPEGGRGRSGDVLGGGSVGVVYLPPGSSLPGDRSSDWLGGEEPMASDRGRS